MLSACACVRVGPRACAGLGVRAGRTPCVCLGSPPPAEAEAEAESEAAAEADPDGMHVCMYGMHVSSVVCFRCQTGVSHRICIQVLINIAVRLLCRDNYLTAKTDRFLVVSKESSR